ncbi:hypothetical protein EYC58_02180 [Candidatus Saccharibacteria bacterium]|nr:MAG: hypothetical protein EYC58_02180 [Candidatus Saccharibacteria bacterium]
MAKSKQKKNLHKITKRKTALAIVCLVIVGLVIFIAIKIFEANKLQQEQRELMTRSLQATEAVYDQFFDTIPNPKQKTSPTHGECSSAGKFSIRYTCGPEARLTVTSLGLSQYLDLNNLALKIYKENGYFEKVSSKAPYENGLDPGLTGIIAGKLRGSDMNCYSFSNYVPEKSTATFSWGCTLLSNNKFF